MPNYPTNTTDQRQNWAGEITPPSPMTPSQDWNTPWTERDTRFPLNNDTAAGTLTNPQMSHDLPAEVIESPTNLDEAFFGSLKATLIRNKGNFIVATFLIGTQNTMSWEGILYEVGNDYVTIYQPGRDRYVVIDMYSLKYMEFYDTRRRELCDALLAERGIDGRNAMRGGAISMADNTNMGAMNSMNSMNRMSGNNGLAYNGRG